MVKRNTLPLADATSTTSIGGRGSEAPRIDESVAREIELIWSSKEGISARAEIPAPIEQLPLIEAVHPEESAVPAREPGLLFQGDNLLAMEALMPLYGGKVDLVYIDPPFATGVSYYSQRVIQSSGEKVSQRAYRDNRARGMQTYLDTMYPRLRAIHQLLAPSGKLFLHCDWRANSMLRLLLDEIFGSDCFRNEIIWRRAPNLGRQAASKQLGRVVDTIYVYSKEPGSKFTGEAPKRSRVLELTRKGTPKGARWDEERKLYFTTAPRGDYTDASIAALRDQGRVLDSPTGKVYIKYFLSQDEQGRWVKEQPVDTLWDDYEVRPLRHCSKAEDMGYDTQKPEGLLRRIVRWATRPGDLVADFYCGSGTTLAVAEDMGRRWIGSDIGDAGVATSVRRLKSRQASFEVRSLLPLERKRSLQDSQRLAAFVSELGDEKKVLMTKQSGWFRRADSDAYVSALDEEVDIDKVLELCAQLKSRGGSCLALFAWRWSPRFGTEQLKTIASEQGVELTQWSLEMDWLRQLGGKKKVSPASLRPDLELRVRRDGGYLKVDLCGLSCALPRSTKKQPVPVWQDMVEEWLIDLHPVSGSFSASWASKRNDEAGLGYEARIPGVDVGDLIAVRVVTIFGERIERWVPACS